MRDIRVEAPLILDLDATQFHFDRGQVSLFVVYNPTAQLASLGLLYSSVVPSHLLKVFFRLGIPSRLRLCPSLTSFLVHT